MLQNKISLMESELLSKWKVELLWWLLTAVIIVIVMLPIFNQVPNFPFKFYNILYIFIAITYTRYLFLFRHTPFAHSFVFKILFPCTAAIITLLYIDGLAEFQRVLDEEGYESFLSHLSTESMVSMAKYIKAEYFFFGVATVICSIAIPFRMIISIWRQRNRGTV